jgi:hypothetical protein
MDDRKDSELPEEPREDEKPPEVGEDPGMVGREPVRKDADERIEGDSGVFVSRDREEEKPTEIPLSEPIDIDPTADPLPYRGQTVEPDQPYQSQGMPISPGGLHEETPIGIPGEDPLQPVGPPEPTTTGTGEPAARGSRTIWLLLILGAIVFCVIVLALVIGGVFA